MKYFLLIGVFVLLIQGIYANGETNRAQNPVRTSLSNKFSANIIKAEHPGGGLDDISQTDQLPSASAYVFVFGGSAQAEVNEQIQYDFFSFIALFKYLQKNSWLKAYLAHINPSHSYW